MPRKSYTSQGLLLKEARYALNQLLSSYCKETNSHNEGWYTQDELVSNIGNVPYLSPSLIKVGGTRQTVSRRERSDTIVRQNLGSRGLIVLSAEPWNIIERRVSEKPREEGKDRRGTKKFEYRLKRTKQAFNKVFHHYVKHGSGRELLAFYRSDYFREVNHELLDPIMDLAVAMSGIHPKYMSPKNDSRITTSEYDHVRLILGNISQLLAVWSPELLVEYARDPDTFCDLTRQITYAMRKAGIDNPSSTLLLSALVMANYEWARKDGGSIKDLLAYARGVQQGFVLPSQDQENKQGGGHGVGGK